MKETLAINDSRSGVTLTCAMDTVYRDDMKYSPVTNQDINAFCKQILSDLMTSNQINAGHDSG